MNVQLLELSRNLPKGKAIKLENRVIMEAIQDTMPQFPYNPARESDVKPYIEKIQANWGILMTQDPLTQKWTMFKPQAI